MTTVFLYAIVFIISARILRLITTPLFRKLGLYRYYSPLFFVIPYFNNCLDIHLGTSYDFMRIERINPRMVLVLVARGLRNLITDLESGKIDRVKMIRGNVHFLKQESLERFGFTVRKLNVLEWLAFLQTYAELCILQTIVHRRLTKPKLKSILIAECRPEDLLAQKSEINALLSAITRKRVRRDGRDMTNVA